VDRIEQIALALMGEGVSLPIVTWFIQEVQKKDKNEEDSDSDD
jgi:signal recognition particle GTPase